MNRNHHRWHSPSLGRDMELLVFGHAGEPVIVFPTSNGRFFDWESFGMVDSLSDRIESGTLQLFCLDSVDSESWYNEQVSPATRLARDDQYDAYLIHEVVPFIVDQNQRPMTLAGCSFGGLHVIDKGLRHPDVFKKLVPMSGVYSSDWWLDGDTSESAYLHTPLWYLPNLQDAWFLDHIRGQHILLCVPEHEHPELWKQNHALRDQLAAKGASPLLDIWGGYSHDWPAWKGMAHKHIGW